MLFWNVVNNSGSEDHNNDNEDPIEVDVEQAYSRREGNTPIVKEADDDVVEVNAVEIYSRRASKEPVTQHPSEDKDPNESNDSGSRGGDDDSSDSWDGSDEDVTEPIQHLSNSKKL